MGEAALFYDGGEGRESAGVKGGVPVKSSGAMWMGVPTMLPDIMASGLQKPRSVIFARFCLSSCPQKTAHFH